MLYFLKVILKANLEVQQKAVARFSCLIMAVSCLHK